MEGARGEYPIPGKLAQLMQCFGLGMENYGRDCEQFARMLTQSMNSPRLMEDQMPISDVVSQCRDHSDCPEALELVVATLRNNRPREFRNLAIFIGQLVKETEVMNTLGVHARSRAAASGQSLVSVEEVMARLRTSTAPLVVGSKREADKHINAANELAAKTSNVPTAEIQADVMRQRKAKLRIASVKLPPEPAWYKSREYLTSRMLITDPPEQFVGLGEKSGSEQEELLVDDVLNCFLGLEGEHIHATRNARTDKLEFHINPSVKTEVQQLTNRILVIAEYADVLMRFVEARSGFEHGLISQALCGALNVLIEEYIFITPQLEQQHRSGQLSLQKLWFFIQPLIEKLKLLAKVCDVIIKNELVGGALLTCLHGFTMEKHGDPNSFSVLLYLLKLSSEPFFKMLEKWIYKGQIVDPYNEFMVIVQEPGRRRTTNVANSEKKQVKRYACRNEHIPSFLIAESDKIQKSGEYINILLVCGHHPEASHDSILKESLCYDRDHRFLTAVQDAYTLASSALLEVIKSRYDLLNRFKSVKHFFMLDQGDFLLQFIESAKSELSKQSDEVLLIRLQNLWELAVRTSSLHQDLFKDNIKVHMTSKSLFSFLLRLICGRDDPVSQSWQPSIGSSSPGSALHEGSSDVLGLESFILQYQVEWPLSYIFSNSVLDQYNIIFRRLLHCKFVEMELARHWLDVKSDSRCHALRHKMLLFIQNYLYNTSVEVIEPSWYTFQRNLEKAKTIEDILVHHDNFLKSCSKDMMLTDVEMVRCVHQLLTMSSQFAAQSSVYDQALELQFETILLKLISRIRGMNDARCWVQITHRLNELTSRS